VGGRQPVEESHRRVAMLLAAFVFPRDGVMPTRRKTHSMMLARDVAERQDLVLPLEERDQHNGGTDIRR
jgi:hypothetical protein